MRHGFDHTIDNLVDGKSQFRFWLFGEPERVLVTVFTISNPQGYIRYQIVQR